MKTKFIAIAAVTALFFTSCNSDDDNIEVNDGRVLFSSGVTATTTRVSGDDGDLWDSNDPIGIYMVETGTTTVAENAKNVLYTATLGTPATTATFSSTTPIYYPVDGSAVDFIAYHPYNSNADNFVYPVDLSSQSSQTAIDLMYATADNSGSGYTKTYSSAVNLPFSHQLSKVVLNVTAGAGIVNLDGLQVRITGMNITAGFNLTTKNFTPTGTTATPITPRTATAPTATGTTAAYEAILLPVTLGATHVITFEVDGNTYSWTMTNNNASITQLESGKKYVFNVTLNKTGVQVAGTINNWVDGGSDTVTAN